VIVDLTVVGNAQGTVFRLHWLMARCNVNNAQAPVAQPNLTVNEHSVIIRATMSNYIAHAVEHGLIDEAT
jgi:hypothetical protein